MPRSRLPQRCGNQKSDFLDLSVFKVYRRRAAEDRDFDLEA
jgi:hypothetical protein